MKICKYHFDIENTLTCLGLKWEREFQFDSSRRWRADWFVPAYKLIIEYEGGTFINGGHTRGAAYAKNCEKYNRAAILGFKVLRFDASMCRNGLMEKQLKEATCLNS